MGLITELRRRNVFRVAIAYTVIAWVLAQVADLAFDNFGAPDWVPKSVFFLLLLGFPLAVFFAWAFEITPEGVKKEKDVDRTASITNKTGRKIDYLIIGVLVIAVGFLLVERFVLQDVAPVSEGSATVADSAVVEATDKSVAVLPFVAMSSGPDDEYFADGLTEEILNSLAQLPELLVTARTSAFSFKGQDVPITEIAVKLGVAHVVEGSVRRAGERLRITAQLIRANDGFHLWSETYDRSNEDSFGIQGEIAEKIASALNVVLDDEELARMRSSGLRNPEAFIAFQKGNEFAAMAHESGTDEQLELLREANRYFDRTIEIQPDYSPAHFEHGDYYVHFAEYGLKMGSSAAEIDEAIELAATDFQNAARTAKTEGERLTATLEQALISGQWKRLPDLLSAAYQLPECIFPSWWGGLATILGPTTESLAMWQRAQACDPLNFYNWANVTETQMMLGNFDAAIDTANRGLAIVSHNQIVSQLINAYIATGQFEQASTIAQRYQDVEESRAFSNFLISAAQGQVNEAQALRDEFIQKFGDTSNFATVAIFAITGDRDKANELAAQIDAAPLGFLTLLIMQSNCLCGIAFDLEYTPNFARLIDEGNFAWPPPSPVKWPLKDW
jgi:adenylate cyclase